MKIHIGDPNRKNRKFEIEFKEYDLKIVNTQLSHVILNMLKEIRFKFNTDKELEFNIDKEDVPMDLRPNMYEVEMYEHDGTLDNNYHKRYKFVLEEMIFSFKTHLENEEWQEDKELSKRVKNGFNLFGKYFYKL